ncbi:MAG: hypothetical protein RBT76_05865 [candidate division Zixibacteria bacterium]|jgi:hypothetical protein|nr:hypothetical protein [candidate division Zixibacteria bacterium]
MVAIRIVLRDPKAVAWLVLLTAISLHVIDEALTNFLSEFNALVPLARSLTGVAAIPHLSGEIWLGGVLILLVAGLALTPIVHRGHLPIRVVATALGVLMILNACVHIAWSVASGSLMPGATTSPILGAAGAFMAVRGLNGRYWRHGST